MKVLSLFNGLGFGAMALDSLGIPVDTYYSSEIDKYANKVANTLFPSTIQLGDITKWSDWDIDLGSIDLLIAGFPCQAWSVAGKQKGDSDPRGALVHDLIAVWKGINTARGLLGKPEVKFMFENVRMKKQFIDYINKLFGVEPICINSALVSAQNRVRYYWTNIDGVGQPDDRQVVLCEILEDLPTCAIGTRTVGRRINTLGKLDDYNKNIPIVQRVEYRTDLKANCMTTVSKDSMFSVREKSKCVRSGGRNSPFGDRHEWDSPFQRVSKTGKVKPSTTKAAHLTGVTHSGGNPSDINDIHTPYITRRYSVRECARLQTVPEHHIDVLLNSGVSNSQLYKMLGNGWTHDVITHIFKGLK